MDNYGAIKNMCLKILESSLNLRVERNKTNMDYTLPHKVAVEQLKYKNIDLYCNVEYMKCLDKEYHFEFLKSGYKKITALFENFERGILCYVKDDIETQIISTLKYPHFLHFKCKKIIII